MTSSADRRRNERVAALFAQLSSLPADERERYLASHEADEAVRNEVRNLLGLDTAPAAGDTLRVDLRAQGLELATDEGLPAAIGSYAIRRLIARGGMGSVYEAEQSQPRRTVALKVVNSVVALPEVLRRFEQEAEVLGRLQHKGIAQVIEAGTFDHGRGKQPFFAMEYVDGVALDLHAESAKLSVRARLELFAEVCDAVHHAHQRGVIHRDLKPSNILVAKSGEPKVLDFGVARVTGTERGATLLTQVGEIVGTLGYMSPEQANGDPFLDTSSDVYSLGVVLYQLLSGRMPLEVHGHSLHAALKTVVEDEPAPLGALERRFKGDLETIVQRAIAKDKRRRYESAAALAGDIRRHLRNEPITARPPTTTYQLLQFARRNRALVGAVLVVLITLVIGLLTTLASLREVEAARTAESEARHTAEREAQTARAINEFILDDMIRAASPVRLDQDTAPRAFRGGRDVKVIDVLEAARPRIEAAFADRPLVRAAVRVTLGTAYRELGAWVESEEVLRQALDERLALLGPDHPDSLEARYEYAVVAAELQLPDATALFDDLLARCRVSLGPDHPRTLRVWGNQAVGLFSAGHVDAAVRVGREVLDRSRAALGMDHDVTRRNQCKLGEILQHAGASQEAAELLSELTELIAKRSGPDDPDRLDLLLQVANARMDLGRYEEAEKILLEATPKLEAIFGQDNVRTLVAKATLASLYDTTGHVTAAAGLHEEVCAGYESELGRAHPNTLIALNNRAIHLRRTGDVAEALRIGRDVLEQRRLVYGEEHQAVAESLDTVGAALHELGDYAAAGEFYQQALGIAEKCYGPIHPRTIDIRFNRANLANRVGEYAVAEGEFRKLIAADSELRGARHPFVAAEHHELGLALIGLGRFEEAMAAFQVTVDIHREIGDADDARNQSAASKIGQILLRLDRAAEAEPWLTRSYRVLKQSGDEDRLRRLEIVEALVKLSRALGRESDAAAYQAEIDSR